MNIKVKSFSADIEKKSVDLSVLRITALWAFSESAFGGILHALTIPLRGLFISSASVLFISLIALFVKNPKEILKSTLVVILIKAVVSPYSPLTAYFALSVQGLLGYILFIPKKFYKISAMTLGLLILLLSGIQKILILTVLFGTTLWNSLDIFIKQISSEFFGKHFHPGFDYGYVLISVYVGIHLIAGLFIGLYVGKLPQKISSYSKTVPSNLTNTRVDGIPKRTKGKKRSWFFRPTGIVILIISISVMILSYLSPDLEKNIAFEIIIMLIRSVVITFLWYVLIAPIIKKIFRKFLANKKTIYLNEMNEIIEMFPKFRKVVGYCWENSLHKKGLSRIKYFLSISFYYLLLSN